MKISIEILTKCLGHPMLTTNFGQYSCQLSANIILLCDLALTDKFKNDRQQVVRK